MQVPPFITVQLLVDTGADTTTIAEMHMRSLQIESTGDSPVRTITTGVSGQTCRVYPAGLRIASKSFGDRPHEIGALEVLGRDFHNEGIDGLLGRDVLSTVQFTLDGPRRRFVLEWP